MRKRDRKRREQFFFVIQYKSIIYFQEMRIFYKKARHSEKHNHIIMRHHHERQLLLCVVTLELVGTPRQWWENGFVSKINISLFFIAFFSLFFSFFFFPSPFSCANVAWRGVAYLVLLQQVRVHQPPRKPWMRLETWYDEVNKRATGVDWRFYE